MLYLYLYLLLSPGDSQDLTTNGITLKNDGKSTIRIENSDTLEEIEISIVGIYEKTVSDVVVKSYDVGTYGFEQSIPYNVTNKDVHLSEINYYTDLSKDTKLIVAANVVKTFGYLPLTSDINFDEMFKVDGNDVLLYFMVRNWCATCNVNNTIEFKLSIKSPRGIAAFASLESASPVNGNSSKAAFCNDSKSSCDVKFQQFQLNSCKLSFSNYVNINGGFRFNKSPVKFSNPPEGRGDKEREKIVSFEMKLGKTEVLYGPLVISWQAFYVSGAVSGYMCSLWSGCAGLIFLAIIDFTPG